MSQSEEGNVEDDEAGPPHATPAVTTEQLAAMFIAMQAQFTALQTRMEAAHLLGPAQAPVQQPVATQVQVLVPVHNAGVDSVKTEPSVADDGRLKVSTMMQVRAPDVFKAGHDVRCFIQRVQAHWAAVGVRNSEQRAMNLAGLLDQSVYRAMRALHLDEAIWNDSDKLSSALIEKYADRRTPAAYQQDFLNDKQAPKQSVAEFYDHLLDLCVRGYPTTVGNEACLFELMKSRFLNGLSSATIVMMLRAKNNLDTAASLKKRAIELEEAELISKNKHLDADGLLPSSTNKQSNYTNNQTASGTSGQPTHYQAARGGHRGRGGRSGGGPAGA